MTHLLARGALSCMAELRAGMPTRQPPPTHAPAGELILAAALLHDGLAAEAARVNQQRAGWAGPGVAQQQAAVLAAPWQRPAVADGATNNWQREQQVCFNQQRAGRGRVQGGKAHNVNNCTGCIHQTQAGQSNQQASSKRQQTHWHETWPTHLPQSSPQECGASQGSHSGSCCLPQ
jgi:hypothetical protein